MLVRQPAALKPFRTGNVPEPSSSLKTQPPKDAMETSFLMHVGKSW